jgi:hypothetical protein
MIGVRSFVHSRRLSSALGTAVVSGVVALTACGGAPEAASPSSPAAKIPDESRSTAAEPGSIEEAQSQIATARAQLGGDGAPGRLAPQAAAPPTADSATRPSTQQDRCGSPCRALASMRRAVTALCRMTGNEDARCTDAKRTLVESEGRVAPCSC